MEEAFEFVTSCTAGWITGLLLLGDLNSGVVYIATIITIIVIAMIP
jgi:hypothetical protein